jgi:hypothetical protein
VRGRLIAVVIAVVFVALAGIRAGADTSTAERQGDAAACQLESTPLPEPADHPIITAAANASATAQTVPIGEAKRELAPTFRSVPASDHRRAVVHSAGKPRVVPLLI